MNKTFLITGSIFGALAVVLGAFGAHGLQQITSDEEIIHGFQTGVQYQMYHALALLAVAVIYEKFPNKWVKWAGVSFVTGIILFSGSLYLLAALKISGSNLVKVAGPITPVGGLLLIAGWLFLLMGVIKKK
ncbi:MAG: DUF423 domain-containing protein [Chitinophagales bacterium]